MENIQDAPWIQDYDKYFRMAYQCTDETEERNEDDGE